LQEIWTIYSTVVLIGPQFIGPSKSIMHKNIPKPSFRAIFCSWLVVKILFIFLRLTHCNLFVMVGEQSEEELQRQKAI